MCTVRVHVHVSTILYLHVAVRIGFEQPSYTFVEPPFLKSFSVSLVKGGNQPSEQTFEVLIEVSNMTSPFQSAALGEDYNHPTSLRILFPPEQEAILWEFDLLPNEDPEEIEAFHATVSSSVGFPNFLNASGLFTETLIVITDAQS